jgi:hypothetical protein
MHDALLNFFLLSFSLFKKNIGAKLMDCCPARVSQLLLKGSFNFILYSKRPYLHHAFIFSFQYWAEITP